MGKDQNLPEKSRSNSIGKALIIPALISGGVAGYIASEQPGVPRSLSETRALLPSAINPACDIKGNISMNTGERIYHVPDQKYYEETRITISKGERWFCSESDARSAG